MTDAEIIAGLARLLAEERERHAATEKGACAHASMAERWRQQCIKVQDVAAARERDLEKRLTEELREGNRLLDKIAGLERDLQEMTAQRDHYQHIAGWRDPARPALSSSDARELKPSGDFASPKTAENVEER